MRMTRRDWFWQSTLAGVAWSGQRLRAAGPAAPVFLEGAAAVAAILEDELDPFFRQLSRLDGELRLTEPLLDQPRERWLPRLKKQFADSVQPWSAEDRASLTAAAQRVAQAAAAWSPHFIPPAWRFVLTDGSEEAGAAYTRHDAIILPRSRVRGADPAGLARLVAHETSHVHSRLYPARRDRLYARLGFRPVGPIQFDEFLQSRKITNPDGVENSHVIRVTPPNRPPIDAALVIYSKAERFHPTIGRRLFDYVQTGLVAVTVDENGARVATAAAGQPTIYSVDQVAGVLRADWPKYALYYSSRRDIGGKSRDSLHRRPAWWSQPLHSESRPSTLARSTADGGRRGE